MALTNAFYEAVESANVRRIRIMMKNSLLVDISFNEFREMEKAASSLDTLYEKHNGKAFLEDSSQWNDDYMDTLMVDVLYNFSRERIAHIQDVVRYLRPIPENTKENYQEKTCCTQSNCDHLGAKIGVGAVAGAAAGGVIAATTGATAVGIAGGIAIGGVIGGTAVAIIANGGK